MMRIIFVIKYPFWSKQPVFHYWNMRYWLFNSGIINHKYLPLKGKYYDSKIVFSDINKLSPETLSEFCELVSTHFMRSKEVDFSPSQEYTLAHFKYHTLMSNIAYLKSGDVMIGAITGRPLNCYFSDISGYSVSSKLETTKLQLSYVDYLCVNKNYRNRDVAPRLIYTYYVNQQKETPVCLFKREGESHFIVPLCVFMTYGFSLDKVFYNLRLKKKQYVLPPLTNLLHINDTKSISIFMEYENTLKSTFKCLIFPVYTNIAHLIETKVLQIYAITSQKGELLGLYIFKDTETKFDGEKSLDCIASFNNTDEETFVNGFLNVLASKLTVKTLLIENISHNGTLIKTISNMSMPEFHSKTSYYFYNYAVQPYYSNEVFILA